MVKISSSPIMFRSSCWIRLCRTLLLSAILLYVFPRPCAVAAEQLRVGIYDLPPLTFVDAPGKVQGLYVDLLNEIAEQEGWKIEYVPGNRSESFARLERGEVDLLAPVAYSENREKQFDFPEQFVQLDWGRVVCSAEKKIDTLFDLQGVKIAVVRGSILTTEFKNLLAQFHIEAVLIEKDDYHQIYAAVASGETAAGISGSLSALTFGEEFNVVQTSILFAPIHVSYAAGQGRHPQVIATISRHLTRLKSDPQSLYYHSMTKWQQCCEHQTSLDKYYYGASALLAGLLFLSALSLYLRRKVKGTIVEIVAVNRELRQKDFLLQAVISGSNDAIFVKDIGGRFLMVNAAGERILQQPAAAIRGKRDADFLPLEQAALLDEKKQAVMRQGDVVTVEEEVTTPAGQRIFLSTIGPVQDGDGEVIGTFTIARDITIRKNAEKLLMESREELHRLNQQFQTLLNGIPDHLILVSAEMKVLWMNRAARDFVGASAEETPSLTCYRAWPQASGPCEGCPVRACFSSGKTQESTLCNGDKTFSVKAFPICNEEGEVESVIKLATDITEKLRLREENDRQNRLSSVGQLSAGIAHEINNPLGLILTNLSTVSAAFDDIAPLLDEHYDNCGDFSFGGLSFSRMREQFPPMLKETGEAARRIRQIVEDLKTFARGGERDVADFYLHEAVQRSLRLTENLRRHASDTFTVDLADESIVISGCVRRLEQVLVNLLANACQALSDRSCTITLTTRYDAARNTAVIVLRDEGVGIPAEHLPKLATPFFTTRLGKGGTGLGLSVSFGIIKEHNGTIHFSSTPGQGTTVTITLPASISEVAE